MGERKGFLFVLSFTFLLIAIHAAGLSAPVSRASAGAVPSSTPVELLHPKYKLPARCFAYVGNAGDAKTWKLPYLLADGRPDLKRLPRAIQATASNYRGKNVSGIPDEQIPDVLVKLGRAAVRVGKMPFQDKKAAAIYQQLEATLAKLGRLDSIKAEKSQ